MHGRHRHLGFEEEGVEPLVRPRDGRPRFSDLGKTFGLHLNFGRRTPYRNLVGSALFRLPLSRRNVRKRLAPDVSEEGWITGRLSGQLSDLRHEVRTFVIRSPERYGTIRAILGRPRHFQRRVPGQHEDVNGIGRIVVMAQDVDGPCQGHSRKIRRSGPLGTQHPPGKSDILPRDVVLTGRVLLDGKQRGLRGPAG